MARTGRFGRQPRSAPSLTNTLVAIAREYQQQRDTNIMNAWEKGGLFEGKKVTDGLVLKHWKERMNGVSMSDPLYDTYKNAVTQLEYTVAESKMTAAYALKKKSDSQMVAFYLGWAKKVPKDSEFYRTLQRDAGQYMRTVKTSNQADIARLKEERYQKQQAATDKQYGAAAQFLTDTMRRLNQSGFADGGLSATLDAPGAGNRNDLTDFDPSNPETSMKLLALLAPQQTATAIVGSASVTYGSGDFDANGKVLYHSDTIDPKTGKPKPVTGQDIINQLAQFDPSFKPGQPVDVAYLTSLLERQNVGLQEQIDRANKTGHMQDAENLAKQKGYVATLTRQVAAWPIERAYLDIRETYDLVANDPTASPMAVARARTAYEQGLSGLVNDSRIAANDNMRSRIQGEIDGKTDMPTLAESFTGNGSGGTSKDASYQKGLIEQTRKQIETVQRDAIKLTDDPTKNMWTYGTTNQSTGVFMPDPNGIEVGMSTVADIKSSGLMPQVVTVDDPRGGKGMQLMVTAVPVLGVAKDPVTGAPIPPQNNQPIAYAYNFRQGGQNNVQYGYLVKDPNDPSKSVMNFSKAENPPWADNLTASPSSSGGNHYEVDFSSYLPQTAALTGAPGGSQLAVDATKAGAVPITGPDGKPVAGFNVVDVGKPTAQNLNPMGTITWDPYTAARSSDLERNALGGTDPVTDFTSLTVSALMSYTDGQAILKNIDERAEFKTQVFEDGMTYAGATRLPDGQWDPRTANTAKLAQAEQQKNLLKNAGSVVEAIRQAGQAWQRMTTGSPYPNSITPQNGPVTQQGPANPVQKLATDLVKGTPFEPLAQRFFDGTLTKKPVSLDKGERDLMVNVGKTIKVPGYEGKTIKTTTTTPGIGAIGGGTSAVQAPQGTPPPKPVPVNPYGGNATRAL